MLLAQPLPRQAVHVASRGLARSLERWLDDPHDPRGNRATGALASYLLRMSCRPTPFGLFAGCTTLDCGPETHLALAGADRYRSHSRLDIVFLSAICRQLLTQEALRDALEYRPNPGLYQVAGQWRLAESVESEPGQARRSYRLVNISPSNALDTVLKAARDGATLSGLVTALQADYPELPEPELRRYLDMVIDSQMLLSGLEPRVTGCDALEGLLATLAQASARTALVQPLASAAAELKTIDRIGPTQALGRYARVSHILETLPGGCPGGNYLHVDLHKPAERASIGPRVIAAVRRGVEMLQHLCPPPPRSDLVAFTAAFRERYQDREVPLMEALDEESGIGFGKPTPEDTEDSPLLAGLGIARASDNAGSWSERDALLLRLLGGCLSRGKQVLELLPEDIEGLATASALPLPTALSANVTLVAESTEAVDRGDFRLLWHGAFGPSGGLYLGRFCHGDPELEARVRRHLETEERHQPEAVFAEIVHLPQDRIGNVICRPSLRVYEIPYHGGSGVAAERQIPVSDLWLRVDNGRVVLRSASLDREVMPRLTTAHNATRAELGVYRFLSALRTQGLSHWLHWDWGVLQSAVFLPRVVAGNLVLARARWRLDRAMIERFSNLMGAALLQSLLELRQLLGLPRWVYFVKGDQLLPLDLANIVCAELLASTARGKPALDLAEFFPQPGDSCVSGPEGRFSHELVVVLERAPRPAPRPVSPAPMARPAVLYTPGSEWLYAKLYTGPSQAERLLTQAVAPLLAGQSAQRFDRWFFLRYADPHPHLRLRFHGDPRELATLWTDIHTALAPWLASGALWRVQLDSYDPEIERYGGLAAQAFNEGLFAADSEAALTLLAEVTAGVPRWALVLLSANCLFDDLAVSPEERLSQLVAMRSQLLSEFRFDNGANRSLARKVRELRPDAEAWLSNPPSALRDVFTARSERNSSLVAKLRQLEASQELQVSIAQLSLSHVHMSANRLLRAAARAQELVLYELLMAHYRSQINRRP